MEEPASFFTSEAFHLLINLILGIITILALVSKIRWSKEYKEAKDEVIRSKDAEIELLKLQIEQHKDFNPPKIREYFNSVKALMEEQINDLEIAKDTIEEQLQEKEDELEMLRQNNQEKSSTIKTIKEEKSTLEIQSKKLKKDLREISQQMKEFESVKVRFENYDKLQDRIQKNEVKRILIERMADEPESQHYLEKFQKTELNNSLERSIADDFLSKYEPVQSYRELGRIREKTSSQQISLEEWHPFIILQNEYPEYDESIIKSVTRYLITVSPYWKKIGSNKDRLFL